MQGHVTPHERHALPGAGRLLFREPHAQPGAGRLLFREPHAQHDAGGLLPLPYPWTPFANAAASRCSSGGSGAQSVIA